MDFACKSSQNEVLCQTSRALERWGPLQFFGGSSMLKYMIQSVCKKILGTIGYLNFLTAPLGWAHAISGYQRPYRKVWEPILAVKSMEIWRLGEKFSFFQFCAQNIDVKCFRASKTFQNVCKTSILCHDSYSLSVEDQKRKKHIFSKNILQPPILVPNQWILLVKAAKMRYSVRLHVLWRDGGFSNSLGALVCCNTWPKVSAKKFWEPSDTSIFWQHP